MVKKNYRVWNRCQFNDTRAHQAANFRSFNTLRPEQNGWYFHLQFFLNKNYPKLIVSLRLLAFCWGGGRQVVARRYDDDPFLQMHAYASPDIKHCRTGKNPVARFVGPTWGPSGADRTQAGPMLTPWTLLSENIVLRETCPNLTQKI